MLFDLAKPRVDVVGAGENDLLLQAAAAAVVHESVGVLVVVMTGDYGRGHFTLRHRCAIEHGHDADLVRTDAGDLHIWNYFKQDRIDAIVASREDCGLASLLPAVDQELDAVLKK